MERPSIAIIGGGIIGCMTAWEIASRTHEASIVVLDRDMVGCGATRVSAGLHVPRGATERVRQMAAYSQDFYEKLKQARPRLPIRALSMSVVASEAKALDLQAMFLDSARLTRAAGIPRGPIRVPESDGVWDGQRCQHADVFGLTQALAQELRSCVSFREGVRVTAIESTAEAVSVELSSGEALAFDQVVLAPGPWLTAPAWRTLLAPLGLRVKKIVALHIEQCPSEHDGAIVFQDVDAFLLPLLDRRQWLFSYTSQEWDVDPDTVAVGLSAQDVDEGLDCLRRFAPDFAERCAGGRVFCDAFSTDRQPRIQTLDEAGRVVFAGAANGSGYRLAPAIAFEAADLLHVAGRSDRKLSHRRVGLDPL